MKLKDTNIHIKEENIQNFLFDDYRIFLKTQWLTQETITFYIKYVNRFINYSKIDNIENFKNYLKIKVSYNKLFDRELKNSTLDKFRKCLIKFYSFLIELEIVESNYAKKLTKVKIPKQLPNSLSEKEIETINNYILKNYTIDFFRYRAYMIFNIILNTWIRRAEITNLKKEDISNHYIKVKNGKWQKDRIIYIPKSFSKQLQDYLEIQNKNTEYLFCTSSWKKLDTNWVNRIFRNLRREIKINIYPHLIRHTYASMCVKRGINIYTLQQQMWHTDLKTTSIYLYLNSKENWEEIQKLSF